MKLPSAFSENYNAIIKRLDLAGIVPLIKINNTNDALPLMGVLTGIGIDTVEVTFRTSAAKDVIRLISSKSHTVTVGAGTIISVEQLNEAVNAGAKYIVTPSFNPKVVDRCIELGVPIFPGCSNPTDIEQAYERGLRVVKFFPAELMGGTEMIKALSGPYPFMKFIPTGGINADNLNKYLSCSQVLCCGGTYIVNEELLKQRSFGKIAAAARESINKMLDIKLDHIAINTDEKTGAELLKTFSKLSGGVYDEDEHTVNSLEVVTQNHVGKLGHIAFSSPNLERCVHYLKKRGFVVDDSTIVKAGGKIIKLHLSGDNAGFTIQLIRRR